MEVDWGETKAQEKQDADQEIKAERMEIARAPTGDELAREPAWADEEQPDCLGKFGVPVQE